MGGSNLKLKGMVNEAKSELEKLRNELQQAVSTKDLCKSDEQKYRKAIENCAKKHEELKKQIKSLLD
jgi:chromosome segregation ATPase